MKTVGLWELSQSLAVLLLTLGYLRLARRLRTLNRRLDLHACPTTRALNAGRKNKEDEKRPVTVAELRARQEREDAYARRLLANAARTVSMPPTSEEHTAPLPLSPPHSALSKLPGVTDDY
jgi:hypothetical protein